MAAYYNEIDPFAAAWLRELIAKKLIADGEVDERSIKDVSAKDLDGFTQCHFFAGIAGWSLALRLAGWPDDRPVWTGSCPCQPFSAATVGHGGAQGQSDERHLWPEFYRLIGERAPDTVFGEQVDDAITWGWWDSAAIDLEAKAYACAAAVLRADGFRAAHERKRLYWVAHAGRKRRAGHKPLKCISVPAEAAFPEYGDPLARAGSALDGDLDGLLHCDGLSVVMERHAVRCYGNAIVPQVAAQFILAAEEAITEQDGRTR